MRTSALVRVAGLGAAVAGLTLATVGPAAADGTTPLPVAVPDTISLYPGQLTQLNVLANDVSPTGDTLAVCKFPDTDLDSPKMPPAIAMEISSLLGGKEGDVLVGLGRASTHVFDYYICDDTHLVPAQLTVQRHPVSPVHVRKVAGKPGRIRVANTNDAPITFVFGHPAAGRKDGRIRVPAGATRTVAVRRPTIAWTAEIGSSKGEFSTPGTADHGRVRGIQVRGEPLPKPRDVLTTTLGPSGDLEPAHRGA
ncbi:MULTISPECIES: hypothetical protein [unclassified Nocardioides]|uniref:hypothetical protein n=1 Tax=unclassified Nocardioides TaxID=2615069 RepID=UPI00361A8517